jgi:Zn-dependent peptidase ImmA (M78 family)
METSFSSPLALNLLAATPTAGDPVDAILWHARTLVIESGLSRPPYSPASYAELRNVRDITEKDMAVDGRLIPGFDSFMIELRKDRSQQRKNFTCAHELAHTFFYEAVPSIKQRRIQSQEPNHDPEEELLCNIAAAEMLMPSSSIREISSDYSPSPEALRQISDIFETSLAATVVRIVSLQIWKATFILWQINEDRLEARWITRPNGSLKYGPSLSVIDFEASGLYHTLATGLVTATWEHLQSDSGIRSGRMQSLRLGADKILSCVTRSAHSDAKSRQPRATLPLSYQCKCNGTGWLLTRKNEHLLSARCLASHHA